MVIVPSPTSFRVRVGAKPQLCCLSPSRRSGRSSPATISEAAAPASESVEISTPNTSNQPQSRHSHDENTMHATAVSTNGNEKADSDAAADAAWLTDKSNPRTWSRRSKWTATLTACYMSCLVSVGASAYSQAVEQMTVELHTTMLLAVSGISFYTAAVAIFPLFLAPLGEAFGRQRVYLASYAIFFLFFLPNALARNIQTVLVARFISGAAGSVGSTMVGGTMSDLWEKDERELPMSLFAFSALLGTPLGPIVFTWAGGDDVSWRWIFWSMLAFAVPSVMLIGIFFRHETLPVESRRRLKEAAALAAHGDAQSPRHGIVEALRFGLRPLHFLATEPITLALSVWIAFAWGTLYLFLEAVPLVFAQYHFTPANMTRGASFVGIAIGSIIGLAVHVCVVRVRRPIVEPEQRLPEACAGALLFTAGFFIFAWTAKPDEAISWIAPQIGTAVIMVGLFMVYICIFDYLGDCYGAFSASAIAAQSFLRNVVATAFPLIAQTMYQRLTYPWASSLLGFIALLLAAVPFVLLRYGKLLRSRSPFAISKVGDSATRP